jgi:leader peptidase (prepilin peptidase)/N-methyltransferase
MPSEFHWLSQALPIWVFLIFGLCVGSFLNVVAHRLPQIMDQAWKCDCAEVLQVKLPPTPPMSLSRPASHCPQCGHTIRWWENIPVLSFLVLRGRCSACRTPISWRYPLVEIGTGALFMAFAWAHGGAPVSWLWCVFAAFLLAASLIDWDTTFLFDNLTLPLLWLGMVAAGMGWTVALSEALWGACAGYLSLWSVYWLFKLTTGKEGMGHGDFKLLAALGAWLGPWMILPIVLGASVLGAAVGVAMKFSGALREGLYVPFGPFLAGAGSVAALAGKATVLSWLGWA